MYCEADGEIPLTRFSLSDRPWWVAPNPFSPIELPATSRRSVAAPVLRPDTMSRSASHLTLRSTPMPL